MERSILYVSKRAPLTTDPAITVESIVSEARLYNERLGITGALASTHNHYAQLLEGDGAILDCLMRRIDGDQRHTNVTLLRVEAIARRRLPDWSLAFAGPSHYEG
ncbi:BLUF domain-containing protein [Sphingomonas sp. GB1N7]|uniref:BLUF domain-containing protein n=1 Tax=Parasphingomonas caseinilytica TaxID=3096158 RepID=UPI002FC7423A